MNIEFTWKNKNYVVDSSALSMIYIILPDGTLIRPIHWIISSPIILKEAIELSFKETSHLMDDSVLAYELI